MIFKKNRFKPLYKKFSHLRENVQNKKKVFKFKKQKWNQFINIFKKKLKRFKKFKPLNQTQYTVSRYPNKGTSYKKSKYRNTLLAYKKFSLFFGGFSKKKIKTILKKKNNNIFLVLLKTFERRLDVILYRAKFCESVRAAKQLIIHGKVFLNNKRTKNQSQLLNQGDLIFLDHKCFSLIEKNIAFSNLWPIPPKHLTINYKTLQIIVGDINRTNFSTYYHFNLNLEKLVVDYQQY